MRIGFNFTPYSPGGHGGSEVFLSNVLRELSFIDNKNEYIIYGRKDSLESYAPAKGNFRIFALPDFVLSSRVKRILGEQFLLPALCARHKLDCLISNYVVPLLAPCPQITILHDVIFKRYPETLEPLKLAYWRYMLPASTRKSALVMTVSQFSAQEIRTLIAHTANKVAVTVEGVRPTLQLAVSHTDANPSDLPINGRYLLCVATFGPHKNLTKLVEAFAMVASDYPDLRLVFVGGAKTSDAKRYRDQVQETINNYSLNDRVDFLGHISDAMLANIYFHAQCLVLPSLYEGFGLPIIEAQTFGCPIVCSAVASMPEIAGDAALTFDPHSPLSIAESLKLVLNDEKKRHAMSAASLENVKRFSWKNAAEDLLRSITSLEVPDNRGWA